MGGPIWRQQGLNPSRPLQPGDTVAVLALSSPVPNACLDAGLVVLRSWGLRIHEATHLRATHPRLAHLAATEAERLADLRAAYADPRVRAVFVGRGGYGAPGVLDLLAAEPLASDTGEPPVFLGFSDVTPVLHHLSGRGLPAIHGPAVTGLGNGSEATRSRVHGLLFGGVEAPIATELERWAPGDAEGRLQGGNLALLAASVGTPDLIPAAGCIVVLEEVTETPARIDRALVQLLRTGWFEGVAGIVLGDFVQCGAPEAVRAVLRERLLPLGVPLAAGAPIGHAATNLAYRFGAPAVLTGRTLLSLPHRE